MKKTTLILLLFVLMFTPQCFAADRYMWIDSSDECTYSFDTTTIKFGINKYNGAIDYHIIDVWLRSDYNDSGRESAKIKFGQIKGIENLSYILFKASYNIKDHKAKYLYTYWYDTKGTMIYSHTFTEDQWQETIPGSYGEVTEIAITNYSYDKTNRYYMEQRSK